MSSRRSYLCLFAVATGFAAVGCSTVRIRVPVMRPAEINLRGKSEIVLGEISGEGGNQIGNLIKDAIGNSEYVKLISAEHRDKILAELSLSASDLADTESRKKLGKMMVGSILLLGRMERSEYKEDAWEDESECSKVVNKKTVKYRCVHHNRKGTASVAAGFDLVEVETGENLKPKRLSCTKTQTTTETDHNPQAESTMAQVVRAATGNKKENKAPPIDGRRMLDQCHEEVAAALMKAIAPWQDHVDAPFLKDGDVPQLELGINYAQRGEWQDAIAKFQEGMDFVNTQAGMGADVIAKVHWDMGLAYEYTFQFDKAIEQVKKAYDMTLDEDFLAELDNIKKLKADREKLLEQTGESEAGGDT